MPSEVECKERRRRVRSSLQHHLDSLPAPVGPCDAIARGKRGGRTKGANVRRRGLLRFGVGAFGCSIFSGSREVAFGQPQQPGSDRSASPEPFTVSFDKQQIGDLHRRIDATLWPEIVYDTGWSTGTNDQVLRDLVKYWRNEYDWFRVQASLNRLSHHRIEVEGEKIHFVWYRGSGPRQKFPLLLLHGWPSSFLEFEEAAPLLIAGSQGQTGFDLVVPSLPGFVFSDAPRAAGAHPGRIADRMHLLMRALGYERYGLQGYDWGAVISGDLARKQPDAVVGMHRAGAPWSPPTTRSTAREDAKAYLAKREQFSAKETGYQWIQRTKPQTLGYALQDSPVGLLAWILEKYWTWSDHRGNLWDVISRDHVLTNVMLYWLTGKVMSASRIYYEDVTAGRQSATITVPTWFLWTPNDPFSSPPRSLWDSSNGYSNVLKISELSRGGHFPAAEQPELWAADVHRLLLLAVTGLRAGHQQTCGLSDRRQLWL